MKRIFNFVLVLFLVGCSQPSPLKMESGRVMASYFRTNIEVADVVFDQYTHLIYIGVAPDAEGKIRLFDNSKEFTAACNDNEVIPMFSLVNGWAEREGEDLSIYHYLYLEGTMDIFIENLISAMVEEGFQGVDVDWEHPVSREEKTCWNLMMQRIRRAMDSLSKRTGKHYYLTTALPDWGSGICTLYTLNSLDFVNIMTYDYCGNWNGYAGNTSPLYAHPNDPSGRSIEGSIDNWLRAGFPADKLILGLSYYGYTYSGFDLFEEIVYTDGQLPAGKHVDGGVGWNSAVARVENDGWTKEFDAATFSTWYFSPDHSSFLACDDEFVVANKVKWAKNKGLGGVFSWSLNLDKLSDGSLPLQEAAWAAWPAKK
ncbi:MAG: glycoside hydrolase family 18 protein [Spirochaetales bacterium]|nr:glycoside hydrolase family 18 protein [Spirochaetales bacterium]